MGAGIGGRRLSLSFVQKRFDHLGRVCWPGRDEKVAIVQQFQPRIRDERGEQFGVLDRDQRIVIA